jgi:hypothetical protein
LEAFLFFLRLRIVGPRSTAAAVEAKNMPQAYFLYAPTILKEIIVYQYQKRFHLEAFLFFATRSRQRAFFAMFTNLKE